MARLLTELRSGTTVRGNDGSELGQVRAVYGSGEGRVAEFLLIHWAGRGETALVGADEVERIDEDGIVLSGGAGSYERLPAFDPSKNPQLHRLS